MFRFRFPCLITIGVHLGEGAGGGGRGLLGDPGHLRVESAVLPHLLEVTVEAVGRQVADRGGRGHGPRLGEGVAPGTGEKVPLLS